MSEKITDTNLEEFKKLVRKAIFLKSSEEEYFNSIPNETWTSIFATNFNGNYNYAQRVVLNKFKEIEKLDTVRVDKEKLKIHNLDKATQFVLNSIQDKSPILFITDFDNDGSLAQAIINEYLKIDVSASANMHVEYAQTVNGNSNRGFTVDLVDKIVAHKGLNPDKKFLIITADNGINSVEEQKKIQARYPLAEIVVTDHHNPDPEMVIEENDKVVIFNPHYKPTKFFQEFNISGATTVGVLLKHVLTKRYTEEELAENVNEMENIAKLSKIANLLDYVNTDPADKPEKDYVITRFLTLQPLLNINNSISKIITGEIPAQAIQAIQQKIPNLDTELLYEEAKNIHIQNHVAKILLKIYQRYTLADPEKQVQYKSSDFVVFFMEELNNGNNYNDYEPINPNYIEQLRPLIFGLTADDRKTPFLDALNNKMTGVFESIKVSEKKMAEELRRGEVITKSRMENSVIAYTDPHILTVFNRKFLNKVYNDENPGFSLTLDSIGKGKVSGSFRSLYNISDILKERSKLEKQLNVKIETPGHEKAAGFIIKSLNPEKNPIDASVIEAVNVFINNSIAKIKENEIGSQRTYLLTDLEAIKLIDRINVAIRGNISNFERITPLLKLTPDSLWTEAFTTKQFSMEDIINSRKYGYITININFDKDTVIVPVELVRKIVENGYKDYMSLNYMDGGVFMAEKVVYEEDAKKVIDLRNKNNKTQEIVKVFEKDFKDKNFVNLSRDQIRDNPFFKYHDYGQLNFDLFERMVIGIIDTNKVDTLAVFDVEANGFANSKLMNFGSMNYSINPESGLTISKDAFQKRFYSTQRGEDFLLTEEQVGQLREVSSEEKAELPLNMRKLLLVKDSKYYLHEDAEKAGNNRKVKKLPFMTIKNSIENEGTDTVTFNREIQATMLAYLVHEKDFKVPQEMTNLTGITQEVLRNYGLPTERVDQELTDFYKDKIVLFGAHNTPYDARVLRANTPRFYETLKSSFLYDSALFAREMKLAYDEIKVASFEGVDGLPGSIYFYNNEQSDFSLTKFIEKDENGYYPDRTHQYLLEIENGNYYLVNKVKHEKVKLSMAKPKKKGRKTKAEKEAEAQELLNAMQNPVEPVVFDENEADAQAVNEDIVEENGKLKHVNDMLTRMKTSAIPNTSVKYSVEKLSEQWMIHSLLLSDEQFDIKHVNLEDTYSVFKEHEEALSFFQDNYHFDSSVSHNLSKFRNYYDSESFWSIDTKLIQAFTDEFLNLNREIQQKFSDAWMYKQVLGIKDPNRTEITNDLVDLVNYQTNVPKDKIRKIYDEAIKFKEKHGIDHILQHEGHINGPWEGDMKGDVAFEDKLTLSLLAQKMYDSYTHDVNDAVNMFNKYALKARVSFDTADELSFDLAHDSYSYRQGLLYNRDSKTEMIQAILDKENALLNNEGVQLLKFKLGGEPVLPQNGAVLAVTREGVSLDRAQIEGDAEKFSFIVVNEQIKNSMAKAELPEIISENILNILKANDSVALEYKEELATRYKYVEYNRKDYQFKELLKAIKECLDDGDMEKVMRKDVNYLDRDSIQMLHNVVESYVDGLARYDDNRLNITAMNQVSEYFKVLKEECPDTRLELVMDTDINDMVSFTDKEDVTEANFFETVAIKRQDPLNFIMYKNEELKLFNRFIEDAQKFALQANVDSLTKVKPRM